MNIPAFLASLCPIRKLLPFTYGGDSIVMAAGAGSVGSSTIQFAQDSYFFTLAFMGASNLDAATDYYPNNFSAYFQIGSTGASMSINPVDSKVLFGPTNNSILEQFPIIFAPSDTLQITTYNRSASANTSRIFLKGYKVNIAVIQDAMSKGIIQMGDI